MINELIKYVVNLLICLINYLFNKDSLLFTPQTSILYILLHWSVTFRLCFFLGYRYLLYCIKSYSKKIIGNIFYQLIGISPVNKMGLDLNIWLCKIGPKLGAQMTKKQI